MSAANERRRGTPPREGSKSPERGESDHYKANGRDIEFLLFEVFQRQQVLGKGAFNQIDRETASDLLTQGREVARDMAKSYVADDRNPTTYDKSTQTVTLPDGFKKAYRRYLDSGLYMAGLPEELGGANAPRSLMWALNEGFLGANPAVFFNALGPTMADVLLKMGGDVQQKEFQKKVAQCMVEQECAATMAITEADAGSDVGAGRTTAKPRENGTWGVNGVKRFITGGDHDASENIYHYVLARRDGAPAGTEGLSLFLVPKYKFDPETGEILIRDGEKVRNGVTVTNVEKKMGLKASPTCELTFDDAEGYLIGDVDKGMREMFHVMRYARMMIGAKSIAMLSSALQHALEEAQNRKQGADITKAMDATAPRVAIFEHQQVWRSLMTQKAYAEGLRALLLYTAVQQDSIQMAEAEGKREKGAERRSSLLLPVVKGFASERANQLLRKSLEVFGGSGYMQDLPLEQYIRDSQIDPIYEGTTNMQALDFFFRNVARDSGRTLGLQVKEIWDFSQKESMLSKGKILFDRIKGRNAGSDEEAQEHDSLKDERKLLRNAVLNFSAMSGRMLLTARMSQKDLLLFKKDEARLKKVERNLNEYMEAFGELMVGYLLLRGAEVAEKAHERLQAKGEKLTKSEKRDKVFYEEKVETARFFTRHVLPRLSGDRKVMRQSMKFDSQVIKVE